MIEYYKNLFLLHEYRGFTYQDMYDMLPFEIETILPGLIMLDNHERKEREEKAQKGMV